MNDDTQISTSMSQDVLVRSLKADVDRWQRRYQEVNAEVEFLLPLATRMAMVYIGMSEFDAIRDQWEALDVTITLIEPQIEILINDTVQGRFIDVLQNFLEDNVHYQTQLPKSIEDTKD